MDFKTISKESKRHGETNDCAVKAVTLVSNHPYSYVHKLFKKHGRRDRQGTYPSTTRRVIRELGMFADDVQTDAKTIKTLRLPAKGRYLVNVRGHILAVINGKVQDWTDGRQHRILSIRKLSW